MGTGFLLPPILDHQTVFFCQKPAFFVLVLFLNILDIANQTIALLPAEFQKNLIQ